MFNNEVKHKVEVSFYKSMMCVTSSTTEIQQYQQINHTSAAPQNGVELRWAQANMINPHAGVAPRAPRRLHGQTAWGCSSLLTETQTRDKKTTHSQTTKSSPRSSFQAETGLLPCTALHTSPRRSPPSSPSPPHPPGSCLNAGHTPAVHPQKRHDKRERIQKTATSSHSTPTYMQPATKFPVVPHLHVDPLIQAEPDQI